MPTFDDLQDTISNLRGLKRAGRAAGKGTMGTAMLAMGGASPLETQTLGLAEKGLQKATHDIVEDDGKKRERDNDRIFR